jgi:hypothetical protein
MESKKEQILSKYVDENGFVWKENALKAMEEYAASSPSPSLREADILKIIKEESELAGVRKYTCINGMGYSQFERNIAKRITALASEGDGWVRVEDELPELLTDAEGDKYCRFVICANGDKLYNAPCSYQPESKTWYMQGDYLINTVEVTHWRPLPNPPTVNQST